MRKAFPYVMLVFVVIATGILFFRGNRKRQHFFDDRITLRKKDKIPYGTYVAFGSLKYIFPEAVISVSRSEPGYWTDLSNYESGQALLIVTHQFLADETEMEKLILFAKAGNNVFISARRLSVSALDIFQCKSSFSFDSRDLHDSLMLTLNRPPFANQFTAYYPGKRLDTYFYKFDSSITSILGRDDKGYANFIHLRTGKGNIYLHLAPLAFSNYFLLHKKNIAYYENVLSVIPAGTVKLVWDEYYLTKFYGDEKIPRRRGWLSVLFRYSSLKSGLLTAFFALVLYVIFEMRRKQRLIPVIAKPRNDSLDFVKTIGRLYYEKGDHKNLCRKMASYFLEHIRNRYKLQTVNLDESFIKALHWKTGHAEKDLQKIISFINSIDSAPAISDSKLSQFHKQLESFYKKA